jgi:NAD(P)-dependent dehydrogenase (short-subunit alcohol dehydrogenase family)
MIVTKSLDSILADYILTVIVTIVTKNAERMHMSKNLRGKVALVTGGSRGLGAVTAEALAEQGADVAISYIASENKAMAVVEKLRAKGVRALAIRSDQADMAAAKPLVDQVVAHFGKLDILVNNAAIAVQGKTVDDPALDTPSLDRQWQVNVMGSVAVTRAAAPVLSSGGRIVFVGSLLGSVVPFAGAADYAGSKAALAGYAKGVARDLGPRNITANVIQPGVMPTDMAADVLGDGVPDALMNLHPIRRIATLEEVAGLVCFLAGPHGGYISGDVINVAGGLGI